MRRALAIDEQSFGPEHPKVARDLNNLAHLLRATNRLSKAEPLFWRQVVIDLIFERQNGIPHPDLESDRRAYRQAAEQMGMSSTEIERRLQAAHSTTGPLEPIAPHLDELLGPVMADERP